jgi:helicase MOV-10
LRHTLGFVANRRRFNGQCQFYPPVPFPLTESLLNLVAITRAKALLIIVGDPSVLSLDPIWRAFLNYVFENDGWVGRPPSWDTSEAVDERKRYDQDVRNTAVNSMMELVDLVKSLGIGDAGAGVNGAGQEGEEEDDEDEVDVFEQPVMEEV